MAILDDATRQLIWKTFMAENKDVLGVMTKAELRAGVDAIDQWTEDNTTSFNQAIPLPARTALSTKQKAMILMYVVNRRYGVL
jgi:hypothetical protein